MLQVLDNLWKEHLASMDHLRQGINLRAYAQKNPKQEYKREAFELFASMLDVIKRDVTSVLLNVRIRSEEDIEAVEAPAAPENIQYNLADEGHNSSAASEPVAQPFHRTENKVGRNDPCPCGSGKKYKNCHGKLT